jgi:uncharacterized protein (TIGR02145 family)
MYVDYYGYWWSASEFNSNVAYSLGIGDNNNGLLWLEGSKADLSSVRCVKD